MAANLNGIIYYKLDANTHGYSGDITKNSGLRGEEIDGNFAFLRGHDIEKIHFDENGTLCIERYNGEILKAIPTNINTDTDNIEYDFSYNSENGTLTIITPKGNEIILEGFNKPHNVYHNYDFKGKGTKKEPLELSNFIKTGQHLPAIKLIDTINNIKSDKELETLPSENVSLYDRYVTKENISHFGKLYPLTGVKKIAERLKEINSEWYIPTKEDWDEILNAIDCGNPNHNSVESNIELGEVAGTVLKSPKYWKKYNNNVLLSENVYGFSIYPVGYCGNRGKNYYGSFGESTVFWTSSTTDSNNDMFVKIFNYDKETVGQNTWGKDFYLSLRLVKKYLGDNFKETEIINGISCNCVHIPGTSLIWTKENICFSDESYNGFTPEEWAVYENNDNCSERYFINEWNGNEWDKLEIKEGESIVLHEGINGQMHEWRLVQGKLIDIDFAPKKDIIDIDNKLNAEVNTLNQRIETETVERKETNEKIWESINSEIERSVNVENQLWETIKINDSEYRDINARIEQLVKNEEDRAKQNENDLQNRITDEENARAIGDENNFNAILEIRGKLDEETNRAINEENNIKNSLSEETNRAINEENNIKNSLNEEINRAIQSETGLDEKINTINNSLTDNINKESGIRRLQITEVSDKLNEEITDRKIDTVTLNNKIANNELSIKENKVVSNKKTIIINNPTENGTNIDVNVDNKTIITNESGVLSVSSDAFVKYHGENAIHIDDVNGGKIVSLKINQNDKTLTNDTQGLSLNLSIKWIQDKIQLIGKDNQVISEINVPDFIKNGILDNVYLDTTDPANPFLSFTFNSATGKETINVPVKDLVPIYYAKKGIILENNTFEIKLDNNGESFLTVSDEGIKLYGVQQSIDDAKLETYTYINNEIEGITIDYVEKDEEVKQEVTQALRESNEELNTNLQTHINNQLSIRDENIQQITQTLIPNLQSLIEELQNELKTTKENLTNTQTELIQVQNELKTTKENLTNTQTELIQVQNELKTTKENLTNTQTELIQVQNELKTAKENLTNTQTELIQVQNELTVLTANAITNVIGTDNEITVKVENNTAVVGFAEDAYFVAG